MPAVKLISRILDLLDHPTSDAEVEQLVGPSTFTCIDCGLVTEVWPVTKPFILGDMRLCVHVRNQETHIARINTLRFN